MLIGLLFLYHLLLSVVFFFAVLSSVSMSCAIPLPPFWSFFGVRPYCGLILQRGAFSLRSLLPQQQLDPFIAFFPPSPCTLVCFSSIHRTQPPTSKHPAISMCFTPLSIYPEHYALAPSNNRLPSTSTYQCHHIHCSTSIVY